MLVPAITVAPDGCELHGTQTAHLHHEARQRAGGRPSAYSNIEVPILSMSLYEEAIRRTKTEQLNDTVEQAPCLIGLA